MKKEIKNKLTLNKEQMGKLQNDITEIESNIIKFKDKENIVKEFSIELDNLKSKVRELQKENEKLEKENEVEEMAVMVEPIYDLEYHLENFKLAYDSLLSFVSKSKMEKTEILPVEKVANTKTVDCISNRKDTIQSTKVNAEKGKVSKMEYDFLKLIGENEIVKKSVLAKRCKIYNQSRASIDNKIGEGVDCGILSNVDHNGNAKDKGGYYKIRTN